MKEETLQPEHEDRIRMEEVYRQEIRQHLQQKASATPTSPRIMQFLNSALGIWFLSTCIVGMITFLYSQYQAKQKKLEDDAREKSQIAMERDRYNLSLVTTLVPYLASAEEREWKLALQVTGYLKSRGELPKELESILAGIVRSGANRNNTPEQQAKVDAAAVVIDNVQALTKQVNDNTPSALPPRVYIQIANEAQRNMAQALQAQLRGDNFIVPGIENIAGKANAPQNAEVRYYSKDERPEALKVIAALKMLPQVGQVREEPLLISAKGVRARHYEVWFAKP